MTTKAMLEMEVPIRELRGLATVLAVMSRSNGDMPVGHLEPIFRILDEGTARLVAVWESETGGPIEP